MNVRKSLRFFAAVGACILAAPNAFAEEDLWGCKVLLCLGDPSGPKTQADCVDPIDRLYSHLRKGRSFPTCAMAGGTNAVLGYTVYDPCPAGTQALPVGGFAAPPGTAPNGWGEYNSVLRGIGEGNASSSDEQQWQNKICVGRQIGTTWFGDNDNVVSVGVFDQVVVMPPAGSPRVIDLYVDGALFRRVRY